MRPGILWKFNGPMIGGAGINLDFRSRASNKERSSTYFSSKHGYFAGMVVGVPLGEVLGLLRLLVGFLRLGMGHRLD